jgi:hypothetical protein
MDGRASSAFCALELASGVFDLRAGVGGGAGACGGANKEV